MVPEDTTRALLHGEAAAIEAWAERHRWSVEIDAERLALAATVRHPADGSPLMVVADLHGYRAVPPAWRFVDPATKESGPSAFPMGGPLPGGKGSIFHSGAVICAPWNRLAYTSEGGPHGDWGEFANWLNVEGDVTRAADVAQMLSAIDVHLGASPGRLA
jgi:hypothetical protein